MGVDLGDIDKVLRVIQKRRISYAALFAVGDLCRVSESGDCITKLILGKEWYRKVCYIEVVVEMLYTKFRLTEKCIVDEQNKYLQ